MGAGHSWTIRQSGANSSLPDSRRTDFLQHLWGNSTISQSGSAPLEDHFDRYYASRCQEFLSDGKIHVCIRTDEDIKEITATIISGTPREEILSDLRATLSISADDKMANTTVDLCASLLIMAEVGFQDFRVSTRSWIPWTSGTLQDQLRTYFEPEPKLETDCNRLGKIFTGRNICKMGAIRIKWTDNLADHLRLAEDDETVFIFHHASFLKHQQSVEKSLLPRDLIDETLQTLALLFPQNDAPTRRWLASLKAKGANLNGSVARCGSLRAQDRQLNKFHYWHTRLLVLKQTFDESQPQTLSQWLWDTRNGVQWYTFWVAILVVFLTLVFGLVQSIEGAIQVYLGYQDQHGHKRR